jgi:hypothetical protein
MANRLHKFFGKDSPDIPDGSDHYVGDGKKPSPPDKPSEDGKTDKKKVAEMINRNQETVYHMVAAAVGPFMSLASQEFGLVSTLACIMGIGRSLADCIATVAEQAGMDEDGQKAVFTQIVEQTKAACNEISLQHMRHQGVPEEVIKEVIASAEADQDNPLDAVSFDDIAKAMGGPTKDDLRRALGEIIESLTDDDDDDDDDGEDDNDD